jgi:hypothetical protein
MAQLTLLTAALGCNGDTKPTDTGPSDTDTGHTGETTDPNDVDGDGVPAPEDCDDTNAARYPGATEHCDGIDNNCVDDAEENIVTVLPDASFATLEEAAAAVTGGETIQICPGVYGGTATFAVPITLIGIADADGVRPTLDGEGGGTTVRLDGAGSRVEGLAITGGTGGGIVVGLSADAELVDLEVYDNIAEFGGGIQFSPRGGSVEASTVRDNIAQEDGGGIYASGTVELRAVELTSNVAGNWGGGLTLGDSGRLTLTDVTISDNTAERGGGVFALANTAVTATGTTVIDRNTASASGGGAYLFTTDWTGGTITANTAVDTGGGLYVYDGGSVTGTVLEANDATRGGGVFASGSVGLEAMDIRNNDAETDGGGAYLLDASATLSGTTLSGNDAPDGGGLFLQDSSVVDGIVSGNTADNGGGIFLSNVEPTTVAVIDGTRVEDNEAITSGGGLYVPDDADLVDVLILRNLSRNRAGGLYVTNEAEVSVQGGSMQSNVAVERGGGLYTNTSAQVVARDLAITQNQGFRGAGIYINNDSSVQLTDCSVTRNGDGTTQSGGGARIITGDLVSITTDWGDDVFSNLPEDVYIEQGGGYDGWGTSETFACDAYTCSPEP